MHTNNRPARRDPLLASEITDPADIRLGVDNLEGATPTSRQMSLTELGKATSVLEIESGRYQAEWFDGTNFSAVGKVVETQNGARFPGLLKSSNCAYFNGSSNYHWVTGDPTASTSFSVMAWVYVDTQVSNTNDVYRTLIDLGGDAANAFGISFYRPGHGNYGKPAANCDGYEVVGPNSLVGGTHHVAAVFTPTSIRLYVDGRVVAYTASAVTKSPSLFRIGRDSAKAPRYFQGKVADARLYSVALTDDEILNIATVDTLVTTPLRAYPLTEGGGTTSYNTVANANHRTQTAGNSWTWSTMDAFYGNIRKGFRDSGGVKIPVLWDGSAAADGAAITNPSGDFHNGAETLIDFTSGGTTPSAWALPNAYTFGDSVSIPFTKQVDGSGNEHQFRVVSTLQVLANEPTALPDSDYIDARSSIHLASTPTKTEWDAFLAIEKKIIIDSEVNLTFPTTVSVPLHFEGTGKLTNVGSSEVSLYTIDAPRQQIFDGTFLVTHVPKQFSVSPRPTAAHTLSFTNQSLIYPEWWGAEFGLAADCANALESMKRALIRSRGDHNNVHWKIVFPANSYIRTTNNIWHFGLWDAEIDFNNSSIENPSAASADVLKGPFGRPDGDTLNGSVVTGALDNQPLPADSYQIATVSAGATSVTLLDNTDIGDYKPGGWVLLACYGIQGPSYPLNPAILEYVKLESVSGSTLNFDEPIKFSYRADFPDGPSQFNGAARAYPLSGFGRKLVLKNIKSIEIQVVSDYLSQTYSRLSGYKHIDVVNSKLEYVAPQIVGHIRFIECQTGQNIELDKLIETCEFRKCEIPRLGSGTGCSTTVISESVVDDLDNWAGRRTIIKKGSVVRASKITANHPDISIYDSTVGILEAFGGAYVSLSSIPMERFVSDTVMQFTESQWITDVGGPNGLGLLIGDLFMFTDGSQLFSNYYGCGQITDVTSDGTTVTATYRLDGTRTGATMCKRVPMGNIVARNSTLAFRPSECWAASIDAPENGFYLDGDCQVYSVQLASTNPSNVNSLQFVGGVIQKVEFDVWQTYTGTGTPITFTADDATDVISAAGHGLANGDTVWVNSDGTLPAGLDPKTTYYVRDSTSGTLKLAATSGGAAIDITDSGTGTHSIAEVPESPGFSWQWKNSPDGTYFVDGRVAGKRFIQRNSTDTANESKLLGIDSLNLRTTRHRLVRWYSTDGTTDAPNLPSHTLEEACRATMRVWVRHPAFRWK